MTMPTARLCAAAAVACLTVNGSALANLGSTLDADDLMGSTIAATQPLVADAGASPDVNNGFVVLKGSGWGGAAPYRFQWTVDGQTLTGADTAFARLEVRDWAPGRYQAQLMLTDRFGVTSTDTVSFVVGGAGRPVAQAGGTYEFRSTDTQVLSGTISGGTPPFATGWDLDLDGEIDARGQSIQAELPVGHHLVRFLVTDAQGLESQQMTSVYVGSKDQVADMAIPLAIIGISDSGINPYHSEFSAESYPDPRVLELTQNFTRHPCEYISDYPCSSIALPITLNGEYYPEQDMDLFFFDGSSAVPMAQPGMLHWIPGTKIIGALTFDGYDAAPSDLILDNNGHGTGSASVSTGNRYGYCPSCLIYSIDELRDEEVYGLPFAEITSHSHGYVGSAPLGVLFLDPISDAPPSKEAAERGVTILFSAGNGVGNAFAVTNNTYGSDQTGPSWTINVGALRRDTSGAIIGEGTPAQISSWGDGFLPSACRTGLYGTCAFGGTSAASPYTAGVFGWVLREVRAALGDYRTGTRPGQVIAEGRAIANSPYLADGKLTRRELRAAVLKTAAPLDADLSLFPYPANLNAEGRYALEGYGAATPNAGQRALGVLLGEMEMPNREDADTFFAQDCELRDALYGSYDRDGDGNEDTCAADIANAAEFKGAGPLSNEAPFKTFPNKNAPIDLQMAVAPVLRYELHRREKSEPYRSAESCGLPQTATEGDHEQFISLTPNLPGDLEPCFDSRVTSTVAGFRPKGIFHADAPLTGALPTGSAIDAKVYVQGATPGPMTLTAVLSANDRVIARSQPVIQAVTPATWTEYSFNFDTFLPAFTGETLGVHFQLTGQVEWAYGFEGAHASRLTITPAAPQAGELVFGATVDTLGAVAEGTRVGGQVFVPDMGLDDDLGNAGFAPVSVQVEVSANADFSSSQWASVDARTGRYLATLPAGVSTAFVRVHRNGTLSKVSQSGTGGEADARLLGTGGRGGSLGLGVVLCLLLLGRRRPLR